jgi:hypothetical protein
VGSLQIQYHLQHHLLNPHRSSRCLTLNSLKQPVFSKSSGCYVTAAKMTVQVTTARLHFPSAFSSHILTCLLLLYYTPRYRFHVTPFFLLQSSYTSLGTTGVKVKVNKFLALWRVDINNNNNIFLTRICTPHLLFPRTIVTTAFHVHLSHPIHSPLCTI